MNFRISNELGGRSSPAWMLMVMPKLSQYNSHMRTWTGAEEVTHVKDTGGNRPASSLAFKYYTGSLPVWMLMVLPKLGRYSSQVMRSLPCGSSMSCSCMFSPLIMVMRSPSRLTAQPVIWFSSVHNLHIPVLQTTASRQCHGLT